MARPISGYRLGIDVGGTFTDVVLSGDTANQIVHKVPSTTASPGDAVLAGMDRALLRAGIDAGQLTFWAHGTTIATNALLQGRGARVGLLTTAGFEDLLEIRRQQRPSLYDLFADKPAPLVPAELRRGVPERLDAEGQIVRRLDEDAVRAEVRALRNAGAEALAVCFLHAYRNPVHERRVREIVREEWPEVSVVLSSEILPEFREYERLSTTVLSAYLGPCAGSYLERLAEDLRRCELRCTPYVLQSNGRLMSFGAARQRPAQLVASGPSAGLMGAAALGRTLGEDRLLTLDMGGTSTDVGAVVDGQPRSETVREIDGHPLKTPMVDVLSIGAGGGSVAWVDGGGFLRVGPQSAGADPGPACYGRDGVAPTVTDAHLLLGRLSPAGLLAGAMPLHLDLAARSLDTLGGPLDRASDEVAQGIIRLANAEMVRALRGVTAARGDDPREFTLLAYGGAGPLHAVDLALALGIRRVVVPPAPGSFCAYGVLTAELGMDFGKTFRVALVPQNAEMLAAGFAELETEAREWLAKEAVSPDKQVIHRLVEARYAGQDHELLVPVEEATPLPSSLAASFHATHERAYGYAIADREVECITLRVTGCAMVTTPTQLEPTRARSGEGSEPAPKSLRDVWWEETGSLQTPAYSREQLPTGWKTRGPSLIEQLDSTTLVPPGVSVRVDEWHNLIIDAHGHNHS